MPNVLNISVENPDEILNAGAYGAGAVVRVQTSATETGVYADVTGTGSTPTIPVITATRTYTAYDPAGTSSSWYRTRFENAGGTRLSDWQTSFQVAPEGSGLICSLWDVKQALGITTTTDDETLTEYIRQTTVWIQNYTRRRFLRTPASGSSTFTFDVPRSYRRTLYVPQGIAAMTQLETITAAGGTTWDVVTTADWRLEPPEFDRQAGWPATGIRLSDYPTGSVSYFTPGYQYARITGALGWDTVPDDIAGVAQRAVVSKFLSKGTGATGPAIVGPTGAMTVLRGISPDDMPILEYYRVPNVA